MLPFCVYVGILLAVVKTDANFISEGMWYIDAVNICENDEEFEMSFNCTKHKKSRTEDYFNAHCNLPNGLNSNDSVHCDVYKNTDGVWKYYSVIKHHSLLEFCRNHSRENTDMMLEAMGLDKDLDNIPEGSYSVDKHPFDSCKMPKQGIIGLFKCECYIIREVIRMGCVVLIVEFKEGTDKCDGSKDNEE